MARWDDVEIVSLDQAKQHLKLGSSTAEDDDLTLKLRQAHGLVLDYVYRVAIEDEMLEWDDETAPAAVQAAILRQFADLSRNRGDGDEAEEIKVDGNDLSPRVKQLLKLYRQPVIA
jgi:hypothetical protein